LESRPQRKPPERFAFTERRLAALARPASGTRYVFDSIEVGLCVRLTPNKASFAFYRWHAGKPARLTLPAVGSVQLREVRAIVAGLRGDLARGIDVFERARQAKRGQSGVATLQDAFIAHLARIDLREATKRDYVSAWKNLPIQLTAKPVTAVTEDDITRLHAAIGAAGHRRLANKVLTLVATLLRAGGRRHDNPAEAVRRFREDVRRRVLTLDELHRMRSSLDAEPTPWRDYFLVLMLTGARRSAVAAMRWTDLDLDAGVWRIPAERSKNHRVLVVALPSEAVALLRGLHAARGASGHVFPSQQSSQGHLTSPARAWQRVCRRAGIEHAVVHDLRRTLGTMIASDGAGAAVISAVLGHASQQSAKAYIHLSAEIAREHLERAAQKLASRAA
jgi:integrase